VNVLKLYTTPYCPLCDEIREVLDHTHFEWKEVNILHDENLMALYKNEIPVVESNGEKWFYRDRNLISIKDWLEKIKKT